MQEIESIPLQIGGYEIKPLRTGIFGLDGGAMFGTVPKVLWERTNPADNLNRIELEARGMLLRNREKVIVVDTGNGADFVKKYGEKLGGKFKDIYNIQSNTPAIVEALEKHGLKPADVTDVILTHLHFDHAGGATTERDGKLVPTFPNATYYVQKRNLETARNPNVREKASYFASNFEPLVESGKLVELNGPRDNVLPNISVTVTDGHTQGQQVVKVSGEEGSLVFCGDLIPTSTHVRLAWVMGYDLEPLKLIEEKRKLLQQASKENWYLFFEHDPYVDVATVTDDGRDFGVQKKFRIS